VIAFIVTRHRPHAVLYLGVPMALVGIYCLNGGKLDGFVAGDFLLIASAVFWAGHMFTLGIMVQRTALPFTISVVSFFVAGFAALLIAIAIEAPDVASISGAWIELIYSGLIATGVALTLQAVAQRYVPPANAAIIIGAESLFAALAGALFRDERLTALGYAGAALIVVAIVIVEAWPAWRARSTGPARPDQEPGSA
jgi:drug/metabolite transporter (DMT)-like permease